MLLGHHWRPAVGSSVGHGHEQGIAGDISDLDAFEETAVKLWRIRPVVSIKRECKVNLHVGLGELGNFDVVKLWQGCCRSFVTSYLDAVASPTVLFAYVC